MPPGAVSAAPSAGRGRASRLRSQRGALLQRILRRRHSGDFVDVAAPIVGDPFADLDATLKEARTQFCAVDSEPLPIAIGRPINDVALGVNTAVFVILDASLSHKQEDTTDNHAASSRADARLPPRGRSRVGLVGPSLSSPHGIERSYRRRGWTPAPQPPLPSFDRRPPIPWRHMLRGTVGAGSGVWPTRRAV